METALGAAVEDFIVEEQDGYPCAGEGEHLFVRVKKSGLSTMQVVKRLAEVCAIPEREVGFAGRKDARGLTTQRLSVPRRCEPAVAGIQDANLQVLELAVHVNKLRLGHLSGNRFIIRLQPVSEQEETLVRDRLETVLARGFPDYYGPQRFGPELSSAQRGLHALRQGRIRGRGRSADFLISAAQSLLFNDFLGQRLKRGLLFEALPGDLLKTQRGGLFTCEDAAADTPRVAAGEVVVTGPMFGRKMMPARDAALTLESEILTSRGLSHDHFSAMRPAIPGTRRALLARIQGPSCHGDPSGLRLDFVLPAGSFASELCRELLRIPLNW
ncbi:MAG: tRNA pseudouridine(13) synthase TruD [Pseudomonadota bacterium]